MKFLIPLFFCFIALSKTFAQDIIKMEKSGGVYLIPCKVNGLPLKFIFDTGASDVSISLTEALFMLKNGYLKESDIKGTVYYSIANGEIAEGTKINIQKIEVGKQTLYNVEASIVHSTEAPLLFGQSAMERFGKFTMDYSNSNLIIGGSSNKSSSNPTNSSVIKSVKIGTQTWMSENLNVDRFRNGDLIPEARSFEEWNLSRKDGIPAWCYYDNDPVNGEKSGKLYNWYAIIDPRGLTPEGWHLPSENDWKMLIEYLGGNSLAGMNLKSNNGWLDNGNGSNKIGFTGFPGGSRDFVGRFYGIGEYGYWCNTTELKNYGMVGEFVLSNSDGGYAGVSYVNKGWGMSVRCIKD